MKPTFEVCATNVLDSMTLPTSAHVLTKKILTELRPRYFESEPDLRPIHTKLERLLSKSLTTLEVMAYYLVVHTGPCPPPENGQAMSAGPPAVKRTGDERWSACSKTDTR